MIFYNDVVGKVKNKKAFRQPAQTLKLNIAEI